MAHGFIYVDRLSPFLFQTRLFGHALGVRWYGLAYAAGFLLALLYLRAAARRDPRLGGEVLERLAAGIPVGVVLGGRLGFIAQHPHELLADPLFVFRVWEGGMAFFGGLAGVLLAVLWVARRHRLAFLAVTDMLVFPAALGLGIGRVANFVNGELVGRPTGGHWGVIFPGVDLAPRHPSQLYESASHLLLFGILAWAGRGRPCRVLEAPGRLSFLFLGFYGLFRFLTDFFRNDDTYWGLFSDGQWISLLVALVGFCALGWLRAQSARKKAASL